MEVHRQKLKKNLADDLALSKDRRPAEKVDFDKTLALFTASQDVDIPAKQGFHFSTSLKSSRDAKAFGFKRKLFGYKFSCRVEVKVCFCL